jgi:CYTH domain-containing protein
MWKLGQKVRFDPASPAQVAHTTIYLNQGEAACLAALPADEVTKVRWTIEVDGHLWSVDEFRERLAGLVLAEIDLGLDRQMPAAPPLDLRADVTGDDRFSGGRLARLPADQLDALLASAVT